MNMEVPFFPAFFFRSFIIEFHYLDESQVPILTSPKNAEQFLSPMASSMLQKDIFAADVYRMILSQKTGIVYPNEYTRKFKKHVTD